MTHKDPVNWQPAREMPLVASMIDATLEGTREHLETQTEARTRLPVLDNATIVQIERVHAEQLWRRIKIMSSRRSSGGLRRHPGRRFQPSPGLAG